MPIKFTKLKARSKRVSLKLPITDGPNILQELDRHYYEHDTKHRGSNGCAQCALAQVVRASRDMNAAAKRAIEGGASRRALVLIAAELMLEND